MPLILALLGCPEPTDTGDSAEPDAVHPEAPVVESADVSCFVHGTGEPFTQWAASATVTDPQGLSTIETSGRVEISDAGGDIGTVPLMCADGACTTSWKNDDYDVACEAVAVQTYDFAFVVVDVDGHESAPLVVAGRLSED